MKSVVTLACLAGLAVPPLAFAPAPPDPDMLVVVSVSIDRPEPRAPERVRIVAQIRNVAAELPVVNHPWEILVGAQQIASGHIGNLPAGRDFLATADWSSVAGPHTITARVTRACARDHAGRTLERFEAVADDADSESTRWRRLARAARAGAGRPRRCARAIVAPTARPRTSARSRMGRIGLATRGVQVTLPVGATVRWASRRSEAGRRSAGIIRSVSPGPTIVGSAVRWESTSWRAPSATRTEVSFLTGAVLPIAAFNQGAVTDSEEGSAIAVRVVSASSRRLTVDAGFTRSSFANPGRSAAELRQRRRCGGRGDARARYLDTRLTIAQGLSGSLAVAFRHERLDPLFRVVGVATPSDREQEVIELQGVAGPAALQFAHTRPRTTSTICRRC